MIYKMSKPSENMLKPLAEIAEMNRQDRINISRQEEEQKALYEAAVEREYIEANKEASRAMLENARQSKNRSEYRKSLKAGLLAECLMHLYKNSAVGVLTESDEIVARNLINNFIKENGTMNLIIDFKNKNVLLSEFARLTEKYYNRAIDEGYDANAGEEDRPAIGLEPKECNFDQCCVDDFFKDLSDVDVETSGKMIKNRVSDAINQFIDDNAARKMEYQDIIQAAQDKIATTTTPTDEAAVERYMNRAKAKIRESRQNQQRSVFHCLVESLTKSVMKDEGLKARFVNEATVDMDGVVNAAALIYTMLEMVNTTGMVNVNEEYIKKYVESLSA